MEAGFQGSGSPRQPYEMDPNERAGDDLGGSPTTSTHAPILFGVFLMVSLLGAITLSRVLDPVPPPPSEEAPPPEVAVMPFYNLALEPGDHYLSYAIPDELAVALRQNRAMRVRPFDQLRAFIDHDPQWVGREVDAALIVTGQFAVEDGELRITLEAIDVEDNHVLWRQPLAVPQHDLKSLRERLSELAQMELATALGVRGVEERLVASTNDAAYAAYLRGIARAPNQPANAHAITELESAVELDPDFAPAWARLARRHYLSATTRLDAKPDFEPARRAARQAIALDASLVRPKALLTTLAVQSSDVAAALDMAHAMVSDHPGNPDAHHSLSVVYRYAGLLEWSQRECDLAYSSDPKNLRFRDCAWAFMRKRMDERATDYLDYGPSSDERTELAAFQALYQSDEETSATLFGSLAEGHPSRGAARCLDVEGEAASEFVATQREIASKAFDPETTYRAAVLLAFCEDRVGAEVALRSAAERNFCAVGAPVEEAPFQARWAGDELEALRSLTQECQDRFLEKHRVTMGDDASGS